MEVVILAGIVAPWIVVVIIVDIVAPWVAVVVVACIVASNSWMVVIVIIDGNVVHVVVSTIKSWVPNQLVAGLWQSLGESSKGQSQWAFVCKDCFLIMFA